MAVCRLVGLRETPSHRLGIRRLLFPEEHEIGEHRMEWYGALRRFALRQTYLATRPGPTHVDHSISEIDVMPLQAQALRYTETCAGGKSVRVRSGSRSLHTIA